ncbi:MAG: hypothetical protein B6229_04125 [Spirochaetaceae bacterium 4572_7]|nr:MAG: hypothetical protein B6229_04125 [Spirochaetaceae bacterium 4572_7]
MRYLTIFITFTISFYLFGQDFHCQEEVYQGSPVTFVISPVEDSYDCTFSVEAKAIGIFNTLLFERTLTVLDRGFKGSILKANSKMDSIINGDRAPERDQEAKRWWTAISSFSPYTFYHEDKLTVPVTGGRHSSPFGFKRKTKYPSGKESIVIHNGEDYALPIGTTVYSDGAGRVILAENRIVSGNTVIIEHLPGVISMYYHMDILNVNIGDIVTNKTKIGEIGTTGFSTGPHIHWEVRFSTIPVDPKLFISTPLIDKTLIIDMISSTNNKRGG